MYHNTNGAHRRVQEQVKKDWKCPGCKAWIRYFWATCPNCSHPREH